MENGGRPTTHFSCHKTMVNDLSCGVIMSHYITLDKMLSYRGETALQGAL